jgi:hypothetical protein
LSMKVHEGPWRSMKVHGRIPKRLMYMARYSEDPRCWQKLPMQVTMATLLTEGDSQRKSQSERRHIDSFKISTLQNLAHLSTMIHQQSTIYALCTVYILYIIILNVPLVHWSKRRCFRNEAIFSPRGRWDVLATPPKGHFWGSTRGGELRALMLVN